MFARTLRQRVTRWTLMEPMTVNATKSLFRYFRIPLMPLAPTCNVMLYYASYSKHDMQFYNSNQKKLINKPMLRLTRTSKNIFRIIL